MLLTHDTRLVRCTLPGPYYGRTGALCGGWLEWTDGEPVGEHSGLILTDFEDVTA